MAFARLAAAGVPASIARSAAVAVAAAAPGTGVGAVRAMSAEGHLKHAPKGGVRCAVCCLIVVAAAVEAVRAVVDREEGREWIERKRR